MDCVWEDWQKDGGYIKEQNTSMDMNDYMTQKHKETCDLLTGDNTDNEKYDNCLECYRYETCKACDEKDLVR